MALESLQSNILPGEIVAPTDAPATEGGLTTVKAPAVKGGFSVGSVGIDATNTAEILANMQKFLDERKLTNTDRIVQGLNEANMSLYHPDVFVQYQKDNRQKEKDLFDMQNQIVALKSAQAMQDLQRKQVNKALGVAPAGGAIAADGSAISDSVLSQIDPAIRSQILDLAVTSPAKAQELYQKTIESMNTERFKAREGYKYSGPGQKQEPYTVTTANGVEQVDLTGEQWMRAQVTGKLPDGRPVYSGAPRAATQAPATQAPATQAWTPGTSVPASGYPQPNLADIKAGYKGVAADVNNPVGIGGAGNFKQYTTPQEGVQAAIDLNTRYVNGQGPMQGIAPTVENMTSVWVNGKPGTNTPGYAPFVKRELANAGIKLNPDSTVPNTPEAIKALTAARIKFESGKNAGKFLPYLDAPAAAAPNAAAPAAAAPSAPAAVAQIGPNEARVKAEWEAKPPTNKAQIEQKNAQITTARAADVTNQQNTQKANLKSTEQERQEAGTFISKISALAGKSSNAIEDADQIINHATAHPKDFGWGYESGPRAFFVNAPKAVPHFGKDISHGVEDVFQSFEGHKPATRRADTAGAASRLGFDFAAETFTGTGARLGLGLEQMANKAKSVGPEYPAETNILNAKLIKYAYSKASEQSKAWDDYKKTHDNPDPYAFINTNEFQNITKKWNDKVHELSPEYRKLLPENTNTTSPSGRKPLSSFHNTETQ